MEDYQEVESSNIDAVKHDANEQALYVVFVSSAHYRYGNVPRSVYDALLNAESVGKYFYANIRNAYPATKVEEIEE